MINVGMTVALTSNVRVFVEDIKSSFLLPQGINGMVVDMRNGQALIAIFSKELYGHGALKVGNVYAISESKLAEQFNPNKHGGFKTVNKETIIGQEIPQGTSLSKAIMMIEDRLADTIESLKALNTIEITDSDAGQIGTQLRMTAESLFAQKYGYYARITTI